MENLKKNFGQRVRKIRQKNNFSQEELAEKIDIAVNNVGKIEHGESFVTAAALAKLSKVLKVKPEDFFKFDNYISLEQMKEELNTKNMSDETVIKLYKFYKYLIDI